MGTTEEAKNRAEHHAKRGSARNYREYNDVYEKEIAFAMSNKYEIRDWAAHGMSWEDVRLRATRLKVTPPEVDYNKDWVNAPMSIQEMEL